MSQKSRLLSFSSLSAMLGFSAPAAETDPKPGDTLPAPTPNPEDEPPAAAEAEGDVADVVLASDAVRAASEARVAGFKAANDRMKAVLESKEGKANLATATLLLCSTELGADAIAAHLATMLAAAAAAPATIASKTPIVDLTGGKPAAGAAEEGANEQKAEDGVASWVTYNEKASPLLKGGVRVDC